ncbi:MAG: ComEA family DNA-binding protein [Ruminococcaceae bacterium]|nr:ComEA family DNA-binding protein [Oscillospiraceae bacterium]
MPKIEVINVKNIMKSINILVIAVIFIVVGFIGSYIEKLDTEFTSAKKSSIEISDKIYDNITVHIKGAVANPNVYSLNDGDRVIDAVNAAGGFALDANKDGVNLARIINDGEEIFIPKKGQNFTVTPSGKININTADERLLKTLPNIDKEMSKKIIEYRETYGSFTKTSDIKKIKGIGSKTYSVLKDYITVE